MNMVRRPFNLNPRYCNFLSEDLWDPFGLFCLIVVYVCARLEGGQKTLL